MTAGALRLRSIPLARLAPEGGMLRAWLARADETAGSGGFLPPPRRSASDACERIVRHLPPPAADSTVEAIVSSLEDLAAPAASRANAEALGREGTLSVIAGQQPGLLGGPLYTLLKAIGTVRATEALEAADRGRRRWVPVFWNASEDHDLDEVVAVVLPGEDGSPRRIRAPVEADGRACRDVSSEDPALDGFLAEVEAALPGGPGREETVRMLRETRSGSIATWFSRILLRWLGERGLVVVEPHHVSAASRPLLVREIEQPGRFTAAVAGDVATVRAAGIEPVLDPAREVNLFLFHEGRRRALVREEDGSFRVDGTGSQLSKDDLLRRIEEAPADLSPNVALRVLVQDATLPVALQLAGPTELGYLAELGGAHADLGLHRPLVHPRPSATLVEPRVERALGRIGLGPEDAVLDPGRLEAAVAGGEAEEIVHRRLESLRRSLGPEIEALLAGAGPEGSGTRRKAARIATSLLEGIGKLERTVVEALRAERGAGRLHRERIEHALRPLGRPQERVYGPLPFLARHGPALVETLLAAVDPFAFDHRIVWLE